MKGPERPGRTMAEGEAATAGATAGCSCDDSMAMAAATTYVKVADA